MDRDWTRLGDRLRADRRAQGLDQQELGRRLGVARGAMSNIENGRIGKVTTTVRQYAREVGWTDGSIEAVLAGGEPEYVAGRDARGAARIAAVETSAPEELPLRIRAALQSGTLIDSTVISLPGDDPDDPEAQMVIVVKGRPDMTPEQLRRALEAWEGMEPKLRKDATDPTTERTERS